MIKNQFFIKIADKSVLVQIFSSPLNVTTQDLHSQAYFEKKVKN